METIRRRLIRPKKLIQVTPFNVVLLWSNDEIRVNDFALKIEEWKVGRNKQLAKLANPVTFMSATIHNNTLAFNKIKLRIPGMEEAQPLDLDPDVLFQDSIKLGQVVQNKDLIKKKQINSRSAKSKFKVTIVGKGSSSEVSYHFPAARHLIQVDDDLIEIND